MKRNYPEVFDRLDQALLAWDNEMWGLKVTRHLYGMRRPEKPPLPHQLGYPVDGRDKTRALIMRAMDDGGPERLSPKNLLLRYPSRPRFNDLERQHAEAMSHWDHPRYGDLEAFAMWDVFHFPFYIARWAAASRRIYYLSEDLMMQLRITSLRGMTLRDIHLPHESFAIALETPIHNKLNNTDLDFFLIGRHTQSGFAYYGLPRSLSTHKNVDPVLRGKINEAMTKGNRARFLNLVTKMHEDEPLHNVWTTLSDDRHLGFDEDELDTDLEVLMEKIVNEAKEDDFGIWYAEFFRTFIGLCIYLKAFESRTGLIDRIENPDMAKKLTRLGPALHSESEVCRVQNFMQMTPDEREIIRQYLAGGGGWEVCAHFRRGYWRRRYGEGHDPNAEKSVRVSPTLVRRDRLPVGSLVIGSAQAYP